jgi:hypothetical protein
MLIVVVGVVVVWDDLDRFELVARIVDDDDELNEVVGYFHLLKDKLVRCSKKDLVGRQDASMKERAVKIYEVL